MSILVKILIGLGIILSFYFIPYYIGKLVSGENDDEDSYWKNGALCIFFLLLLFFCCLTLGEVVNIIFFK